MSALSILLIGVIATVIIVGVTVAGILIYDNKEDNIERNVEDS